MLNGQRAKNISLSICDSASGITDKDNDEPHQPENEEEQCCSTVMDEMEKKYLCDEDFDAGILLHSMTGTSPCKLAIEKGLRLVVLNDKRISRVGDNTRLLSLAENVTEADFAWNNLSEWSEIGTLLKLPNLRVFNLSHNPLNNQLEANQLPIAPLLQTLIINGTNLSLKTMRHLLESTPALSELHLSENRLIEENTDEECNEALSLSVETVHVNRCNIKRWETIMFLRELLPRCNSMFIADNPIRTTYVNSRKVHNGMAMSGINQLNMNKCLLDEWMSIEALAEISTLRDLRIAHNPLLAQLSVEEKMHLIIARMPLLEILNGSAITDEQREKSERFFIRYYDECEMKPPIFEKLVARHGKLEQLCKVDLSPRKYANVTALCEETGFRANVKINLDHSVGSLMRTLEKHTGIPIVRMRLFLLSSISPFSEELRFPNQRLSSLRIDDGDQFLIQSKIVVNRKKPTAVKK